MASGRSTGIVEHRADLLNIPILKFSYSTASADRTSPLGWTHLSSSGDLAVVFDHIMPPETSSAFCQGDRRLRVFRSGAIMEQLNLNSLAREAAAVPSHAFAQNMKPPVAIIVKSPCLAVRYPMRNDQTRRFQIKFSSDADYSTVISIFNKLGCPITHSAIVSPQQASSNRPFSSTSQTPSLLQIGSGAHATPPVLSARPTREQYHGRPCPSSLTEQNTSGSVISSFSNISASTSSGNQVNQRPHTSAVFIPSTGPAYNFTTPNLSHVDMQGQSSTPFHTAKQNMVPISEKHADARQPSDWAFKDRPVTSPALPDVDSLNKILPPKRDLPFAKPGTKPRSRHPSHSRGPANRLTRTAQPSGLSSPSISQAAASTFNTNENPPAKTNQESNGIVTKWGANGDSTNPYPPFRRTQARETLEGNNTSTSQKSTSSTGIDPSASFTNGAGNGQSEESNNVSNEVAMTTQNAIVSATPQLSAERCPGGGFIFSAEPTNTRDISPSELSAYLSTRSPERTALVESWVCSQLENDSFLALCQDVEGVWRRIAFGY
ncbi:hypothetical protein AJ78_05461 [Emergomyces pasteurianus Ep9510]|uniref:Uncharacterized protein n=1 Tax=Emergomyces pasteurianus Ep9510 TaxID=1447872 RepID=A0A1J9PDT0_9EURO|nr:hypothetical protein AJ78_05461 [Emergomyces pasteurianus Ep9510]